MKLPVIVAAIACASVGVSSQPPPANAGKFPTIADVFHPATFAARRARLSSLVADGVVVLFGEKNPIENVFYLTGLSFPDLAVVIDPAANETVIYAPATH